MIISITITFQHFIYRLQLICIVLLSLLFEFLKRKIKESKRMTQYSWTTNSFSETFRSSHVYLYNTKSKSCSTCNFSEVNFFKKNAVFQKVLLLFFRHYSSSYILKSVILSWKYSAWWKAIKVTAQNVAFSKHFNLRKVLCRTWFSYLTLNKKRRTNVISYLEFLLMFVVHSSFSFTLLFQSFKNILKHKIIISNFVFESAVANKVNNK